MKIPPGIPRSRSFTRFTIRVGLLHFGQSVLFVVSMTFLRSPVFATLAIKAHLLKNLFRSRSQARAQRLDFTLLHPVCLQKSALTVWGGSGKLPGSLPLVYIKMPPLPASAAIAYTVVIPSEARDPRFASLKLDFHSTTNGSGHKLPHTVVPKRVRLDSQPSATNRSGHKGMNHEARSEHAWTASPYQV